MTTQLIEPRGPVLGLPHLVQLRSHPVEHNTWLRESYGEVVRLKVFGTTVYATHGPDAAEQVLVNRDRVFANGPAWSHFIGPFFRRGIMLLDFDEHLHHRRIMQQAFAPEALRRYHALIQPHAVRRLEAWADVQARDGQVLLQRQFRDLTLELALDVFVGVDLSDDERARINRSFIDAVRAGTAVVRMDLPGSSWRRGLQARARLEAFFHEHLPAKRTAAGRGEIGDLFTALCAARSDEGHAFADDDVVNHMIFLLMAAHDTTTTTLTTIGYQLARHPAWQDRLRAISVATGDASYEEVLALDVHDRVMKESLRLCSPVPSLPRMATRETEIGGFRIPAGALVVVSPYLNHYDPAIWPDPERFDPERFAEHRREDKAHRLAYEPFGAGVHKCIGMHFAGMQVRTVLHELLRRYRWSVPDDYTWPLDLAALPVVRDGLPVTLEPL